MSESVEDRTALIGVGRRSCEYIRQLHQALSIDCCAFLIDHDSESRQEDTPPADTFWIGHVGIVPDFSFSKVMGVVIVGAEHQNPSEMYSFKLGLQKNRPALLLGIVLPSLDGEPVRINLEFLTELDSVIWWPGDPALPEWGALLFMAVDDWLAPVLSANVIYIDFSEMVRLFCGNPQPVVVASASAPAEQLDKALCATLDTLHQQGCKLDQATGVLAMIHVVAPYLSLFEQITDLIADRLPDNTANSSMAVCLMGTLPIYDNYDDRNYSSVTLFFAMPSTGLIMDPEFRTGK